MIGWLSALAAFVGMWLAMMIPMMLPSVAGALRRYGLVAGLHRALIATLAYYAVWACAALLVFPIGVEVSAIASRLAAPMLHRAAGLSIIAAGLLQVSAWKLGHLACCRNQPVHIHPWMYGTRLGMHCVFCCLGFTAVLLVVGMMEVRAMLVVMAAITVERLAPRPQRVARILGVALIIVGGVIFVRG